MVTVKRIVTGILIIIGGYAAYHYFFTSEESKIRKQFDAIAKSVAREPGENPLAIAGKLRTVEQLFAEPCRIEAQAHSVSKNYSRQEITQLCLTVLTYYSKLSVSFYDMKISVSGNNANVISTVRISGKLASGEDADDIQEVECNLTKHEKEWLFREFILVDVLKK